MSNAIKYLLPEFEMLKSWYNIVTYLPITPPLILNPGTGNPVGPNNLSTFSQWS